MDGGPGVQVEGAHLGNVCAQVPVDTRALDADEGAEVETGPGGGCHAAVCALIVARHRAEHVGFRVPAGGPGRR